MMRFYIGTYTAQGGEGVFACEWDGNAPRVICAARELDDPTYLLLSNDGQTLYASGARNGEGAVAGYAVEETGLRLMDMQPANGKDTCHLAVSPDGRTLYAANYATGSVSVFPLENGRLLPMCQQLVHTGSGPNARRQKAAHVHQCVFQPGTGTLFAVDLGADRIALYNREGRGGRLEEAGEISVPAGTGPRHLLFDGPSRFYLAGELANTALAYQWENGRWRLSRCVSTLPAGFAGESYAAAIRLRKGALYVSNRGHDSIAVFTLSADGTLRAKEWLTSQGCWPRDFDWLRDGTLLIANQKAGGVYCGGHVLPIKGATCVCVGH